MPRNQQDDRDEWREQGRHEDVLDDGPGQPGRPSVKGAVSFALSLVVSLGLMILLVMAFLATVLSPGDPLFGGASEGRALWALTYLGFVVELGLALVGLILGVMALLPPHRGTVFAYLGVVFNTLTLLGCACLACAGVLAR